MGRKQREKFEGFLQGLKLWILCASFLDKGGPPPTQPPWPPSARSHTPSKKGSYLILALGDWNKNALFWSLSSWLTGLKRFMLLLPSATWDWRVDRCQQPRLPAPLDWTSSKGESESLNFYLSYQSAHQGH